MAITAEEIAKICNVSRGTVDRALHGRAGVSEATRARILQVAQAHHYAPHPIASALSGGRTMSIGVVLFNLQNRYFSEVSNAISLTARARGYSTYIAVTEKKPEAEMRILRDLAAHRTDGLILLPILQGASYLHELDALGLPIVTLANRLAGIPHVSVNDFEAAYDGAHHIARMGYRSICFICPPLRRKGCMEGRYNLTAQDLRAQGFLHYMSTSADLPHVVITEKDFTSRAVAMVRAQHERTAFFCSSDVYALQLLKHFRREGVRVPEDAGVMGFDNLDILDLIEPSLCTVSCSIAQQGTRAVELLLGLISGEAQPEVLYVPHSIRMGDSL